eukprot:676628-Hanusia_phi.AAC.1
MLDSSDNDTAGFHTLEEFDEYLKKTLQSERLTTTSGADRQACDGSSWSLVSDSTEHCSSACIDVHAAPAPNNISCTSSETCLNAIQIQPYSAPHTVNKQTSKLTLGEKLEIIRQYENADNKQKTHTQFAKSYGKSRSAISKLLKPENIMKLKIMAATGVQPTIKRSVMQVPDFDRAVREFVLKIEGQSLRRSKVQAYARDLAKRMGILNFSAGRGWYNGFMRRYGLGKRPKREM